MENNKLTVAIKERIKSVLENKSVWELLSTELIEGTITMNVSEDLRLEIQEYEVLLIDRTTGDVAQSYSSVERALGEDRLFKFVDEYTSPGVTFDDNGVVLIDGNSFDQDAIGVWTDGSKFLYLDKFTNELILSEYNEDDIECINSLNLLDFEDCCDEYTDKFNVNLYRDIRKHLLSPENKDLMEEIKTLLDTYEKLDSKKCNELSRKISLIGLKSFESIGKSFVSDIVDEFCSSKEIDTTFIVTNDKAMVLISRVGKLDVLKDIELSPTFNDLKVVDVAVIEDILSKIDAMLAEDLDNN